MLKKTLFITHSFLHSLHPITYIFNTNSPNYKFNISFFLYYKHYTCSHSNSMLNPAVISVPNYALNSISSLKSFTTLSQSFVVHLVFLREKDISFLGDCLFLVRDNYFLFSMLLPVINSRFSMRSFVISLSSYLVNILVILLSVKSC